MFLFTWRQWPGSSRPRCWTGPRTPWWPAPRPQTRSRSATGQSVAGKIFLSHGNIFRTNFKYFCAVAQFCFVGCKHDWIIGVTFHGDHTSVRQWAMIIGNVPYLVFCNIVSALFIPLISVAGDRGAAGRSYVATMGATVRAVIKRDGDISFVTPNTNPGHHGLCSGMLQHLGHLLHLLMIL